MFLRIKQASIVLADGIATTSYVDGPLVINGEAALDIVPNIRAAAVVVYDRTTIQNVLRFTISSLKTDVPGALGYRLKRRQSTYNRASLTIELVDPDGDITYRWSMLAAGWKTTNSGRQTGSRVWIDYEVIGGWIYEVITDGSEVEEEIFGGDLIGDPSDADIDGGNLADNPALVATTYDGGSM